MGKLIKILISEAPDQAMVSLDAVRAVAGQGLEGDRYFTKQGTFSPDRTLN